MSRDWPGEMPRVRVFGNFKPSRFAPKPKKERARDRREGMSEAHLALIRRLWCVVTNERSTKIDPHHLRSGPAAKERGLGLKCTDKWVLPVTRATHNQIEGLGSRNEFDFFDAHGINPYELADALWANTGSLDAMAKVMEAHQEQAAKVLAKRDRKAASFKRAFGSS